MNTDEILTAAQAGLSPVSEKLNRPEANRLDFYLTPDQLHEGVKLLLEQEFYIAAITGLDFLPAETGEGQIEILYQFCKGPAVVTLRIQLPYSTPTAPSICDLIPSATLYERELIEMFGVHLEGTPSTERLLLPDDWPDGVFPLRKSFTGLKNSPGSN